MWVKEVPGVKHLSVLFAQTAWSARPETGLESFSMLLNIFLQRFVILRARRPLAQVKVSYTMEMSVYPLPFYE